MKDGYYAFYVNPSSGIIDTSYSPEKGGTYNPGSIVKNDPTDIRDIVTLSNTYVDERGIYLINIIPYKDQLLELSQSSKLTFDKIKLGGIPPEGTPLISKNDFDKGVYLSKISRRKIIELFHPTYNVDEGENEMYKDAIKTFNDFLLDNDIIRNIEDSYQFNIDISHSGERDVYQNLKQVPSLPLVPDHYYSIYVTSGTVAVVVLSVMNNSSYKKKEILDKLKLNVDEVDKIIELDSVDTHETYQGRGFCKPTLMYMIYYHIQRKADKEIIFVIQNVSKTKSKKSDKDIEGLPACFCYLRAGEELGLIMYDMYGNTINSTMCINLVTSETDTYLYKAGGSIGGYFNEQKNKRSSKKKKLRNKIFSKKLKKKRYSKKIKKKRYSKKLKKKRYSKKKN